MALRTHRPSVGRQNQRGMSLIEVLVASGVLGFGVVALANLYTATERSAASSRDREVATQLAVQRAEFLATIPVDRLPACPGAGTCRAGGRTYTAPRTPAPSFQCTQVVDRMEIADPTVTLSDGKYRIDTAVDFHGDTAQQDGARVVTVSVCWTDIRGVVHEVRVDRLLVPEV